VPVVADDSGTPVQTIALPPVAAGLSHTVTLQLQAPAAAQSTLKVAVAYTTPDQAAGVAAAAAASERVTEAGLAVASVLPLAVLFALYDSQRRPVPSAPPSSLPRAPAGC
jgi:hypothetical protein